MAARVINFYMDDSGARHPDHKATPSRSGNDWFALGGVLIREEDEDHARELYRAFCGEWGITYPLHSADIRARSKDFRWLNTLDQAGVDRFFSSLDTMAVSMPVTGIACVIDRPGYNARYREMYGRQRWSLCKTAFCVVVERAVKYASAEGYKLRVFPERCSKKDDNKLKEYYRMLRSDGHPFDNANSSKYAPLESKHFGDSLYDFKLKSKTSPMAQLADLYLWPMCVGGYRPDNRTYQLLMRNSKLIDARLSAEDVRHLGIKYSCFEPQAEGATLASV